MKRKITAKEQYTTYASFPLVTGDVRAYEICLDLGQEVPGAEFKVTAIRPDGRVVEDIGSVEEGVARYTMASNMYSVPGELVVRLAVLHDMSVLTDREIVFQVLEGAEKTDTAETLVSINDSVILRLGTLEQKLSEKVDKESGKSLSSNDFTDEYKQKLDGMDDAINEELERISEDVDNLSDGFDDHKKGSNPHNVTAFQVGAYTKNETDEMLKKKADKSDISSIYRFKGSVATLEDLPTVYKLLPVEAPSYNGQVCGTLEDGVVTVNPIDDENLSEICIPVEQVVLKKGYYAIVSDMQVGMYQPGIKVAGCDFDGYMVYEGRVFKINEETVVDNAYIIRHTGSSFTGCQGDVVCTLIRVRDEFVDEESCDSGGVYDTTSLEYYENCEKGDVYNVLEDDLNYAWTGDDWDSLGGEHKDLEARAQIGNVEEALDEILEIQRNLIGGENI